MFHALLDKIHARPVMSSLVGLVVGASSALSITAIHTPKSPQVKRLVQAEGAQTPHSGGGSGVGGVGFMGGPGSQSNPGGGGRGEPGGEPHFDNQKEFLKMEPQNFNGPKEEMKKFDMPREDFKKEEFHMDEKNGEFPQGKIMEKPPFKEEFKKEKFRPDQPRPFDHSSSEGRGPNENVGQPRGPAGDHGGQGNQGFFGDGSSNRPMNDQGGQEGNWRNGIDGQQSDSEEWKRREEEDQKRQEQEEARRKAMEEKQLAMMKKNMNQAERGIQQMSKFLSSQAKKGVHIPSECTEAVSSIQTILAAVKKATTMEEVQDAGAEDMRDHFDTLNECRMKVERLAQIPRMLKDVDRQIKNAEKALARAKRQAPEDAQEAIQDATNAITSVKTARAKVQDMIKTGEFDDLEDLMQDEIFGRFDDIYSSIQRVEAARNAKRFVAEFTRNIKDAKRVIVQLKKRGKDTAELEDMLARAESLYAKARSLKTSSPEFQEVGEELAELAHEFFQSAGGSEDMEKMFGAGPNSGPRIEMPRGF